ncbi:MAG: DEAD/DEAH box helicase [Pirellulales bacterium]
MFQIRSNDEGYSVTWDSGDEAAARELRMELTLEGLQRGREWADGVTVLPYRNKLETLTLLVGILDRLELQYKLAEEIFAAQQAGEQERSLLDAIRAGKVAAFGVKAKLPEFATARKLLDYQQRAVQRHLQVRNGAEFSVPGAGKTTVALAYWALARRTEPQLGLWIIGPLSCFRPWEDEFEACFGKPSDALRVRGTPRERQHQLDRAHQSDVVLCSYHTAWREERAIKVALGRRPWLLVLDEAHYVKSMSGALAATVRALAPDATRRLVLTGTPMPRSPEDLWSLFTFLWPTESLLGNAQQHELRCKRPISVVCEELRTVLAPFFHRTCKQDLGLLPIDDKYPSIPAEEVPQTQRLMLRLIERKTLEEAQLLRPVDQRHVRRWRRARVIRLLQAASNPLLLANALDPRDVVATEDDEASHATVTDAEIVPLSDIDSDLAAILRLYRDNKVVSAKVAYVERSARELIAANEKVVIWTVFLGNVDLLAERLSDLRPLCITGAVPPYEAEDDESGEATREQRITLFKTDPDRRILIANAAACAESISLHRVCQHALYLERSFNAAHFIQSLDRIHRQGMPPGKTAHVEVPYLPCAIERVLNRRLSDRQERLFRLLDDPMPVIGFDDEQHQGFFDLEDLEGIDELFAEVLDEIRTDHGRQ